MIKVLLQWTLGTLDKESHALLILMILIALE